MTPSEPAPSNVVAFPNTEILRLRLIASALLGALKPFADACIHLHPSQPDDGLTLDGIEVRQWRAAYAAVALAEREAAR